MNNWDGPEGHSSIEGCKVTEKGAADCKELPVREGNVI